MTTRATTTRIVALATPLDLRHTVGHLRTGRSDPTMALTTTAAARASWTPQGPVTLLVDVDATSMTATATVAGPGSDWMLDHVEHLLGCDDDVTGFDPHAHEVVARLTRRLPGFRIGHTGRVADVLAPTILAQKVTASEAARSWQQLVVLANQPAPAGAGLPDLLLPPSSAFFAGIAPWRCTAAGVDRTRAVTLIEAHRRVERLEEAATMPPRTRRARLTALRGIGPWTAAIIERAAFGDPDAVEVGDFHVPNTIAWNLVRQARADDATMLALLSPFAGHRGRVVRIVELAGQRAPRFGPRLAPRRFGAVAGTGTGAASPRRAS